LSERAVGQQEHRRASSHRRKELHWIHRLLITCGRALAELLLASRAQGVQRPSEELRLNQNATRRRPMVAIPVAKGNQPTNIRQHRRHDVQLSFNSRTASLES